MILFCFSSRTSKQYDMQYNTKRNTLTTSPKTRNPQLPIFISDFTEKQAQSCFYEADLSSCAPTESLSWIEPFGPIAFEKSGKAAPINNFILIQVSQTLN